MTKETKHTSGPWHANCAANDKHNKTGVRVREPLNGDVIATVNGGANARLIAAAPALLEALQSLLFIADSHNLDRPTRQACVCHAMKEGRTCTYCVARAAIAAATKGE